MAAHLAIVPSDVLPAPLPPEPTVTTAPMIPMLPDVVTARPDVPVLPHELVCAKCVATPGSPRVDYTRPPEDKQQPWLWNKEQAREYCKKGARDVTRPPTGSYCSHRWNVLVRAMTAQLSAILKVEENMAVEQKKIDKVEAKAARKAARVAAKGARIAAKAARAADTLVRKERAAARRTEAAAALQDQKNRAYLEQTAAREAAAKVKAEEKAAAKAAKAAVKTLAKQGTQEAAALAAQAATDAAAEEAAEEAAQAAAAKARADRAAAREEAAKRVPPHQRSGATCGACGEYGHGMKVCPSRATPESAQEPAEEPQEPVLAALEEAVTAWAAGEPPAALEPAQAAPVAVLERPREGMQDAIKRLMGAASRVPNVKVL